MEKITTTTVYLEVPVSERLPEKPGNYPVCSKNKSTQWESIDDLRFNTNGKFSEIPNWDHLYWLEKNEEMVCMSKVNFQNIISDAITDAVDAYIKNEHYPSDKFIDKYINNLFK